ncbi:HD domain-containing phosphohydrolase [Gordonia sp. NPDC003376]
MTAFAAPRRVEVLAGLSIAIDLGLGQPAEHMLRSAIIACRLADRLGLDTTVRDTVYYATLVMWIGCHADSPEYARWFGDDIAVRHDAYLVDWTGLPYLRFLVGNIGRGDPFVRRMVTMSILLRDARGQIGALVHSHCRSASALARHIGLGENVAHAVGYTVERFDGRGLPAGAAGDEIPIAMRVAQLADMVEVHDRTVGVAGAVAMVRRRRGGQFDPQVADAFLGSPADALPSLDTDLWIRALDLAPDAERRLHDPEIDTLLQAIGDFADLKCPFLLGHSRNVAALVADAASHLGLADADIATVRRAGYVHDVGRMGISNRIWSKPGELTTADWERVRLHPYLTDRVLSRIPSLSRVAMVARSHHESLDGTGYPTGLGGSAMGRPERLLAAAVAYRSALEPRPYRDAMSESEAAALLARRVAAGALDGECVEAVLAVSGQQPARTRRDDRLTPREAEILGLVARGLSNREIADRLVVSEKTVRNHVERSYAKIGASNRVGASLYAVTHGLVAPPDG